MGLFGGWECWAFLIVAAVVWILGSLLRNTGNAQARRDQGRPPPGDERNPGPQRRPQPAPDVDRFLQEINRRKQLAEQRAREARQAAAQAAQRSPSREQRGERDMMRSVPPVQRQPRRPQERPAPPPSASRSSRPRLLPDTVAPVVMEVVPVEEVVRGVVPTVPAAPPQAAAPPRAPSSVFPSVTVKAVPAGLVPLAALLRSPDGLRTAIILREILAPPLCRRSLPGGIND